MIIENNTNGPGLEKKLILIAGATGGIGNAFYQYFVKQPHNQCLGIGRKEGYGPGHIKLDLLNAEKVKETVEQMDLQNTSEILCIHTIGIDKFEFSGKPDIDQDGDGIDDEVYASNVRTFTNLAHPLIDRSLKMKIAVHFVGVASISDIYKVPFWQSYSRSKDELRKFMRQTPSNVRGTMLNVSSVNTNLEQYHRPFAERTYWLYPDDLVTKAIPLIERTGIKYVEADIFNPSPDYTPDYFTNHQKLLAKWLKEMGFKNNLQQPSHLRI